MKLDQTIQIHLAGLPLAKLLWIANLKYLNSIEERIVFAAIEKIESKNLKIKRKKLFSMKYNLVIHMVLISEKSGQEEFFIIKNNVINWYKKKSTNFLLSYFYKVKIQPMNYLKIVENEILSRLNYSLEYNTLFVSNNQIEVQSTEGEKNKIIWKD